MIVMLVLTIALPATAQDKLKKKSNTDLTIERLNSDSYEEREAATLTLVKLAKSDKKILARLTKLLKETKSPEVKSRLSFILHTVKDKKKTGPIERSKRPGPAPALPEGLQGLLPKGFKLPGGNGQPGGMPDFQKLFEGLGGNNDLQKMVEELLGGDGNFDIEKMLRVFMEGDKTLPAPEIKPTRKPTLEKRFHASGIKVKPLTSALRGHLGLKKIDVVISVKNKTVISADSLNSLKDSGGKVLIIRSGKKINLSIPRWKAKKVKDKDF